MPATLHGPARTGEFPSGLAIVVICSFGVPGSLCQEGGKTQRTDCQIRDFVSPAIFFLKTDLQLPEDVSAFDMSDMSF